KNDAGKSDAALSPALTIYNQQFAVVKQRLAFDLKSGRNHVEVNDITAHLEPDSVFLRSLDDSRRLTILEQNYRNDPVSELLLLSLFEGKVIDFLAPDKTVVQAASSAAVLFPRRLRMDHATIRPLSFRRARASR